VEGSAAAKGEAILYERMSAMNNFNISNCTPIFCGLILLGLSKVPVIKPLKPMLGILAGSGLLYGMLKFMLGDQAFCGYVGHRVVVSLNHFRFIFAGIGIGAVLTSWSYGHWSAVLHVAIRRQQSMELRKKRD
jgi:hypothetical protein